MTMGEIAQMTLVRPFVLCVREPIVFFWNMYIALVYGIIYIFIASFEVVFVEGHGFNLGENGLAFMVRLLAFCDPVSAKYLAGAIRWRISHICSLRTIRCFETEAVAEGWSRK